MIHRLGRGCAFSCAASVNSPRGPGGSYWPAVNLDFYLQDFWDAARRQNFAVIWPWCCVSRASKGSVPTTIEYVGGNGGGSGNNSLNTPQSSKKNDLVHRHNKNNDDDRVYIVRILAMLF
jgi:hypothetical protein